MRIPQLAFVPVTSPVRRRVAAGHIFAGLALALSLTACNKAEQEKKIAEIQKSADARVAQAEQTANEKIAALEKQVEAIKAEAADAAVQAKAEVDEAANKAQLTADEAAKAVQAALAKAREAYKADARTHLADLNKEFTDVATLAAKTPAKAKVGYDKFLKEIVTHQKEIAADINAFDKAGLDTFKTAKAKLAKDLALMKAAIKNARAKLPKH
jgi:polyhydroxyalkanoate synthesis regulator phasin